MNRFLFGVMLVVILGHDAWGAESIEVRTLALPANGRDFVVDEDSETVFVTIPTLNRVAEISLSGQMKTLGLLATGFRPDHIAISNDGKKIYTTLGTSGSFTIVDRITGDFEEVVIVNELGHASTFDIEAGIGDEVFVSANPSSSGFAYIVRVDLSTGQATRVAGQRIIRGAPTFAIDRQAAFLYIGEGFSPNSIYKLDIALPGAPIVAEDNHGSISGSSALSLNPSGTRLATASSQIVRTIDITQAALLGAGVTVYRPEGAVLGSLSNSVIQRYSASTFDSLPPINIAACGLTAVTRFAALRQNAGWLVLSGSTLCKIEDTDVIFGYGFD